MTSTINSVLKYFSTVDKLIKQSRYYSRTLYTTPLSDNKNKLYKLMKISSEVEKLDSKTLSYLFLYKAEQTCKLVY